MYSKGFGKIAGLTVKIAATHGSTIVTVNEFDLPVSTPRDVKALVTTV